MKQRRTPSLILLYLISAALILGMKYWYRSAGSSELDWILSPTARWVEILSGTSFEKIPNLGYINHPRRFIIAPSCSGVQFMLIAFAALCFPFLCRMGTARRGSLWMALSLPAAYLYTIAANGIRILLSIYIPSFLDRSPVSVLSATWLTPEKLHTIIGTATYFTSLLILYHGADAVCRHIQISPCKSRHFKYMPAAVCYFSIVLGIPFLGRIYRNSWENFAEYCLLTAAVCLPILLLASRLGKPCKNG